MKGKFITFEGSEGCGKSTQSKLLYEYLKRKVKRVVYVREPGGTKVSEKIRRILLDPKNTINPLCETLLYMAARAETVSQLVKPAILKGYIVICDRFLDSTVVYQGFGLGVDIGFIYNIARSITAGIKPDLTILLDLPVAKGLRHRRFIKDRIEKRSLSYHQRVRKGYLRLARQEPERIKVIKVKQDKYKTQKEIKLVVDRFLEKYR
ncbi:MAG: dTMP kinase [Candidatus Omnitrophica bacterium]|nr:dTMP kinase [Candidatus Omnitrophota bacterium]